MQLSRRGRGTGEKPRGFIATGAYIVKRETPLGLYKGLGAVITGIVPKMACRFLSFEQYKGLLADKETGVTSPKNIFLGESNCLAEVRRHQQLTHGCTCAWISWSWSWCYRVSAPINLRAWTTCSQSLPHCRAVVVVNPMEVVKIRLQAQQHSLADPLEVPRYRNAAHALYTIVREEGFSTLYRGVALTAARQATNQGEQAALHSNLIGE